MSDTVKLIIEIPKCDYENIKKYYENSDVVETLYSYVYYGTPLANDSDRAEVQAYFAGQTYGWEQGRKKLIDDLETGFINSYPKNYMGEPELGGATCHFSLNKVLQILDNIGRKDGEEV